MPTRTNRHRKDFPFTLPIMTDAHAGNLKASAFSPGNKLTDLVPILILVVDQGGSLVHANAACRGTLQFTPEELSGRAFMELVAEKDRRKTAEAIMQCMSVTSAEKGWSEDGMEGAGTSRTGAVAGEGGTGAAGLAGGAGGVISLESRCYRKDLSLVHIKWSLHWDHAENMLYCFGEDISERLVQEELASLEKEIIHLNMQSGVTVRQVTHTLLEKVEMLYPGTVCSILRLHPDNTLWNYAAPTLSKEYRDLINGFKPGPGIGSCGTAVHCDKVVIVGDIQNDPLWKDYKDIAAKFGLKACWSVPIHDSKGKILGAFGIYHHTVRTPTEIMLRTFERLASLIGLLIENSEIVEDLRLSNERYELAAQAT
ncbi:MAG TPA: GAF domain-containing protein, partial [Puia sp.]|nr:GAF domain-containing protein [Puia sp.]